VGEDQEIKDRPVKSLRVPEPAAEEMTV